MYQAIKNIPYMDPEVAKLLVGKKITEAQLVKMSEMEIMMEVLPPNSNNLDKVAKLLNGIRLAKAQNDDFSKYPF